MELLIGVLISFTLYILGVMTPFYIQRIFVPKIGFAQHFYEENDSICIYIVNLTSQQVNDIDVTIWVSSPDFYECYQIKGQERYLSQFTKYNKRNVEWHCRSKIVIPDELRIVPKIVKNKNTTIEIRVMATHSVSGIRRAYRKSYTGRDLATYSNIPYENLPMPNKNMIIITIARIFNKFVNKIKYKSE